MRNMIPVTIVENNVIHMMNTGTIAILLRQLRHVGVVEGMVEMEVTQELQDY